MLFFLFFKLLYVNVLQELMEHNRYKIDYFRARSHNISRHNEENSYHKAKTGLEKS